MALPILSSFPTRINNPLGDLSQPFQEMNAVKNVTVHILAMIPWLFLCHPIWKKKGDDPT
jgi:hypothetical protein